MTAALLREELCEYSLLDRIRERLPNYGFVIAPTVGANVLVREAFPTPTERESELTMTTVAFGFNIDDGGREVELGSNLTEYKHTLTVWTFATEPRFGRRLAHAIKHAVRGEEDNVPLLDYNQEGNPVIDALFVEKAQVQHQVNNSPRPWDQFVWTTALVVRDYFYP